MSIIDLRLGDSLQILPSLQDESVDAVITDPPYGIAYQSGMRRKSERFDVIAGDVNLDVSWIKVAYDKTKFGGCIFVFCRWDVEDLFKDAMIDAGYDMRSQVIWDRGIHGMGSLENQYAPMHDTCWFATKGTFQFRGKRPKSVLRVDRVPPTQLEHPTQKPVALMKIIIMDLTRTGDTVLDPFMGSGTTGVACAALSRDFVGIEIDPKYYEIASNRIADANRAITLFDEF